jgi:membrane-bound lytic murein transglycosylase B
MSAVHELLKPARVGVGVVVVAVAALGVAQIAGGGTKMAGVGTNRRGHGPARVTRTPARRACAAAALPRPVALTKAVSTDRRGLASELDLAQEAIDDPSSTQSRLAAAGLAEQLAARELSRGSRRARRATLSMLTRRAADSMRANVDAADALARLAVPLRRLPHWRIVQPPAPDILLGYYRTAQSRFGVPWEDLAAIELVKTRFGRIRGLSPAGAEGPMQFMPATWVRYGRGDIANQHDAILGAARYLAANGAPHDMASALYRYNNSIYYVRAVEDYARRMRSDSRAFYGYYYWQVIYPHGRGEVILPVGYPRARPISLGSVRDTG